MSNKLKAITTKAKALYKTGRFKKWTDAIKAASKTVKTVTGKVKKARIGAAGDYAKFEIATIKALAKKLKKTLKATQVLVNNDQTILNIISNSFDQKLTPAQTVKVIIAEITPVEKTNPLNAFVKLLSKPGAKNKSNFPMKLPATVTIGSVKKKAAKKKAAAKSYHKDTHSHNVKISVMSGDLKHHHWTTEFYIKTKKEILQRESVIKDVKSRKKELVLRNGLTWYNNWIKDAQKTVTAQKKLLTKIKPFI